MGSPSVSGIDHNFHQVGGPRMTTQISTQSTELGYTARPFGMIGALSIRLLEDDQTMKSFGMI